MQEVVCSHFWWCEIALACEASSPLLFIKYCLAGLCLLPWGFYLLFIIFFSPLPLLVTLCRNCAFVLSSSILASCHFRLSAKLPAWGKRVIVKLEYMLAHCFLCPSILWLIYLSCCCALEPWLWNRTLLCLYINTERKETLPYRELGNMMRDWLFIDFCEHVNKWMKWILLRAGHLNVPTVPAGPSAKPFVMHCNKIPFDKS